MPLAGYQTIYNLSVKPKLYINHLFSPVCAKLNQPTRSLAPLIGPTVLSTQFGWSFTVNIMVWFLKRQCKKKSVYCLTSITCPIDFRQHKDCDLWQTEEQWILCLPVGYLVVPAAVFLPNQFSDNKKYMYLRYVVIFRAFAFQVSADITINFKWSNLEHDLHDLI